MKRVIRITGWTMIWSGVFTLGIVGYQIFVTDLFNSRVQAVAAERIVEEFETRRESSPPPEEFEDEDPATEPVSFFDERAPEVGEALATIEIPAIGLDQVVFEGVDPVTLTEGPGHMPWTPLPGQPGNAVLSGHRVTHGRPFFDLGELEPGDEIIVETAIGSHTYVVRSLEIVTPTDVWVTEHREGAWLTLTTCHPQFSARERLIVFAEMVDGPNLDFVRASSEQGGLDLAS